MVKYRYLIFVSNGTMVNYYISKYNAVTQTAGYFEMEYFVKELKNKGFKSIKEKNTFLNPNIYIILEECQSYELDTVKIEKEKQKLEKNFPRLLDFSKSNIKIETFE